MVGFKNYAFGKINENGNIILIKDNQLDKYLINDFPTLELNECKQCKILPICMGKCYLTYKKMDFKIDEGCSASKFNINSKLKFYMKNKMEIAENP
jgi:radical SAM protein with 4Fe4S-binding SPASM domain